MAFLNNGTQMQQLALGVCIDPLATHNLFTTSSRPPPLNGAVLGLTRSIFANPKCVAPPVMCPGHFLKVSCSWNDSLRCHSDHRNGGHEPRQAASFLRPPPLKIVVLGLPRSVFANPKCVAVTGVFSEHFLELSCLWHQSLWCHSDTSCPRPPGGLLANLAQSSTERAVRAQLL